MVTSLLKHDRIRTTDAKAKEIRSWADHVITLAKRGDLHARRQALAMVREKDVVHKLFEEAGDRFGPIAGGYTRVVKVGRRRGDAASLSIVELVATEKSKKKKLKKKTEKEVKPTVEKKAEDLTTGEERRPETAGQVLKVSEGSEDPDNFDSMKTAASKDDDSLSDSLSGESEMKKAETFSAEGRQDSEEIDEPQK